MNYNKLKEEIDSDRIIILEQKDAFKLIRLLDSNITIPWIYNFVKTFKIYKNNDDYIIVINKRRN